MKVFEHTASRHKDKKQNETKEADQELHVKEIYRFGDEDFYVGVQRMFEYIDHMEAVQGHCGETGNMRNYIGWRVLVGTVLADWQWEAAATSSSHVEQQVRPQLARFLICHRVTQ